MDRNEHDLQLEFRIREDLLLEQQEKIAQLTAQVETLEAEGAKLRWIVRIQRYLEQTLQSQYMSALRMNSNLSNPSIGASEESDVAIAGQMLQPQFNAPQQQNQQQSSLMGQRSAVSPVIFPNSAKRDRSKISTSPRPITTNFSSPRSSFQTHPGMPISHNPMYQQPQIQQHTSPTPTSSNSYAMPTGYPIDKKPRLADTPSMGSFHNRLASPYPPSVSPWLGDLRAASPWTAALRMESPWGNFGGGVHDLAPSPSATAKTNIPPAARSHINLSDLLRHNPNYPLDFADQGPSWPPRTRPESTQQTALMPYMGFPLSSNLNSFSPIEFAAAPGSTSSAASQLISPAPIKPTTLSSGSDGAPSETQSSSQPLISAQFL